VFGFLSVLVFLISITQFNKPKEISLGSGQLGIGLGRKDKKQKKRLKLTFSPVTGVINFLLPRI
jgi:hypothetical protein